MKSNQLLLPQPHRLPKKLTSNELVSNMDISLPMLFAKDSPSPRITDLSIIFKLC